MRLSNGEYVLEKHVPSEEYPSKEHLYGILSFDMFLASINWKNVMYNYLRSFE